MYEQVIDFVKQAGERLREKAGSLPDIGVTKRFLTEEDLRIEREFAELIKTFGPDHRLYAEEEHDFFETSDNVWVMDPISGTRLFMNGEKQQMGAVDARSPKVLFVISRVWNPPEMIARFANALKEFNMYRFPLSDGVAYAYVASGKFDAVIALTKDTFPDFAGSLLVKEAGGIFTNN